MPLCMTHGGFYRFVLFLQTKIVFDQFKRIIEHPFRDFRKGPESVEPAWNGQMQGKEKRPVLRLKEPDFEDDRSVIQACND